MVNYRPYGQMVTIWSTKNIAMSKFSISFFPYVNFLQIQINSDSKKNVRLTGQQGES